MTEIREGGRAPCFLGKHCNNVPKAFDFSVEVCDDICKKLVSYDSDMVIKDWIKIC